MSAFVLLLVLVNLALVAGLFWIVRSARRREDALRRRLQEIGPVEAMPPSLESAFALPRRRLVAVEILNPLELAAGKHKLAGLAGSIAPAALRKIVYDQATKITKEQLAAHGVEADVQVHVAG